MSRLIDADKLKVRKDIRITSTFPLQVEEIYVLYPEDIEKAPTVDLWHYPSKGDYPDGKAGLFLVCLKESYRGIPHMEVASGWTGSSFLSQDANEYWQDEVRAWQYITPPKEEA